MTSYICIGKGKTDANGVAQLTHDCQGNQLQTPGYTGQGKGKLDIIASTDGPSVIDSGSVVSEPYPVLDCTFKDLLGENTSWNNNSNLIDVSIGDYVKLKPTSDSSYNRYYAPSSAVPSAPFVIEFEKPTFQGTTTNAIFVMGTRALYYAYYNLATAHTCKFQVNADGSIYVWIDGERMTDSSYNTSSDFGIRFQIQGNNELDSIEYRNFKIYPI